MWAAFEAWERPGGVRLNVRERAHRSHAVTALELPGAGTRLREWTERHAGLTLGIGIVTTVFTAFTVTRLIVSWWVRLRRPQTVPV